VLFRDRQRTTGGNAWIRQHNCARYSKLILGESSGFVHALHFQARCVADAVEARDEDSLLAQLHGAPRHGDGHHGRQSHWHRWDEQNQEQREDVDQIVATHNDNNDCDDKEDDHRRHQCHGHTAHHSIDVRRRSTLLHQLHCLTEVRW
jgi:hypothetical protein